MDRAKKARTPVRKSFTTTSNDIKAELAKQAPDGQILKVKMKMLDTIFEKLQALDDQVKEEMLDADATEQELEAEQECANKYQEEYVTACVVTKRLIKSRDPSPAAQSENSAATVIRAESQKTYNLPKIEIKKFNGELTQWLSFWSQFQKIHNDKNLEETDKFQYLVQSMTPGSRARDLVESYPQTATNYPKVIHALEERFGKKKLLQQVYVRELLKMVIINAKSKEKISLSTMYDRLESHLRSLESLDVTVEQTAQFLFPMVESSLPEEILIAWQRSSFYGKDGTAEDPPKTELDYLMQFLRQEVAGEEQRTLARSGFSAPEGNRASRSQGGKKKYPNESPESTENVPTVAGLYAGEKTTKCSFCEKPHENDRCGYLQSLSYSEKIALVQKTKCCLRCLRGNHWAKKCKAFVKCLVCNKQHTTILCPDLPQHKNANGSQPPTSQDNVQKVIASFSGSTTVYLGTFRATIINGKRKLEVRALYDPGAQRSYVTKAVADKLNLQPVREEKISHSLFGGVQTGVQKHNVFSVNIKNQFGPGFTTMNVLGKDKICGEVPRLPPGPWLKDLKLKKIWISDMAEGIEEIDLLVGADMFGQLLTGTVHQLQDGLTAIKTLLGWIVMGSTQTERNQNCMAMSTLSLFVSEASPAELWSLESIGIGDPAESKSIQEKELAVKQHFLETVTHKSDGRYSVKLPWIDGNKQIPNNKKVAEMRLVSTTKSRLQSKDDYNAYEEVFNSWLKEGIIEEVKESGNEKCHYLPHRPVFKPESTTTPVRPVFDASCKTGRNPSLNDGLEKGPNVLELIPAILLRFRENKIGVISDIRKAFLMIDIDPEDRDYLRFLWWENSETNATKIYRHCRVVFGVNCSPFLLGAVLELHLSSFEGDRQTIANKLLHSLYVDNCVTSVNTMEEYEDFKMTSIELMAEAKMDLRQWEHNYVEGTGVGSSECGQVTDIGLPHQELTSVLGLKWNKKEDTLAVNVSDKKEEDITKKISKRSIMSKVHSIYDPLGILCPAMLKPKIILRKAWAEKTEWDEELSENLKKEFLEWWEQAPCLGKLHFPRCVDRNYNKEQIHAFGDASQDAYAAVVFLRVETDEGVKVHLLQAKTRVAPLKRVTIPRLELLACTILSRLTSTIKEAINAHDVPTYYWSDSTTALAWIRRNDAWGTFVGNRVKEICSLTQVQSWRHVPGALNPADLPSRGCTPEELRKSKWWEGPSWLKQPENEWPCGNEQVDEGAVHEEIKKKPVNMVMDLPGVLPWYINTYSSYSSNVRVLGWILRFIKKTRKQTGHRGELKTSEIVVAERKLFQLVQNESFYMKENSTVISGVKVEKGEDGIFHVKTKLLNRLDTPGFKSPVLLPNEHPLVELLIREEHIINKHAGAQCLIGQLREKCWILQCRKAVKKVISSCVQCRRFNTKTINVPEAPLPEDRIKDAKTFQITGVDLAGPLFLRDNNKAWIVLFTCAVYRCVHLEMVTSLSTEAFLYSLQRFVSRRGRPEKIYSDNGTNFVGTANLFKQIDWKKIERDTRVLRIQWVFNPPSAAWWGGFWERLIRSIKDLLKRSLGHSKLNDIQLQTCLCEVEAVMNRRPLTYITEDSEDLVPLTPAMFMQDMQETEFPELDDVTGDGLRRRYRHLTTLRKELHNRFRTEYLALLVHRGKAKKIQEFHVGDVVLVGSDNKKRVEWPMGLIQELRPGKDGNVRVAKIKTAAGHLIRPLQRLYPLEVTSTQFWPRPTEDMTSDRKDETLQQKDVPEIRTRFGRLVKPPERY